MKILIFILFFINSLSLWARTFEELFPVLTSDVIGKQLTPKTTEELHTIFENKKNLLPRIFIRNLPQDFKEKGSKKLFCQVLTSLVLKENEKILGERILFLKLKEKYEKQIEWTSQEKQFFDYLVEKYDAIVLKSIPTKINDLMFKIDEMPPSLVIAQAALQTNWGKENMDRPFSQMSWKDRNSYTETTFNNLDEALESYIKEMNSTPNYYDWRISRAKHTSLQTQRRTMHMAQGLRAYKPEDVMYVNKIRKLMRTNPFIFDFDDALFEN